MPLRLGDVWKRRSTIGNWRLPGEPAFANSRAFELLSRDLRRYVLEEVTGRSFLIAGHRGAGKTSTVTHAIRRLRNDILTDSTDPASVPTGRRGRLQRPMMVKLVGQALLSPPPRIEEIEDLQDPPSDDETGAEPAEPPKAREGKGGEGEAGSGGETAAKPTTDMAGNALVHITIALYRALAAEIAEGFAVHALEGDPRERNDRLELAAQLALELDGTPEPATLRSFWDRIGRLQHGVLWPPLSDAALKDSIILDQGLKEVVALSTAAQAFQVCSGAVHYSVSRHQVDTRKNKTESSLNVKELVQKLGALGAGALAGSVVGVAEGPLTGVGIGLLVWVLGGATLSWTGSRERNSDRTLNYQFLQDRSIQTLDRDLPVVIDRIRHAGLAPVFVIDELDKLIEDKPGEKIAEIIRRLKHLVADYGFFCFLTNRDYFDEVERTVAETAYPTEHTYFSERVLVLSRAEDLYDYLIGLLQDVPEDGPEALRAAVFALVVMFRSKLNFSDVAREVAALTGPGDVLISTDEELQAPGRYRLAATIQIAIDRVLASEEVAERMKLDSAFAQRAVDALYYIPRMWESDDAKCVDIRPRSLRDDLLERMGAPKAPVPDPLPEGDFPGDGEECAITASDLRELVKMVGRLAFYLQDFEALQSELLAEVSKALLAEASKPGSSAGSARLKRLSEIVVLGRGSLIKPLQPPEPGIFCFGLNELWREIEPPAPPPVVPPTAPAPTAAPPPPPPPARRRQRKLKEEAPASASVAQPGQPPAATRDPPPAARPVDGGADPAPASASDPRLTVPKQLVEAIAELLSLSGLSVDDLVANDLFPATVSQAQLEGCRSDIAIGGSNPDAAERAINTYLAFVRALDDRGSEVAQALVLLERSRLKSGTRDSANAILARLARYFDPSSTTMVPAALRLSNDWVSMSGNADSIRVFVAKFKDEFELPAGVDNTQLWTPLQLREISLWKPWRDEVERFLLGSQTVAPAPVSINDAITAAANLPPGNLFRLRLARMDAVDWSRVALAGVPYEKRIDRAPVWPLFAGLRALRFNSAWLWQLRNFVATGLDSEEMALINTLAAQSCANGSAILHVLPDQPSRRTLPVSESQPVLAIGTSEFESYIPALNWLAELEAFSGGTREID